MRKISELWSVGWSFSFFMVTNRSVVLYYSKVKGVALRDALLGYNNNYLRLENDADLSPVEGLFRPSTNTHEACFRQLVCAITRACPSLVTALDYCAE